MAYQPFYIVNAQNREETWEVLEEKDWDYMKEMYPQMAKEIQDKVDEECDKLEYDGSVMFDEHPDKLMIRTICDRIYKEIQEGKGREMSYAEDEEGMNETERYSENMDSSAGMSNNIAVNHMPADNISTGNLSTNHMLTDDMQTENMPIAEERARVCTSCQRRLRMEDSEWESRSLQGSGWGASQGGPGWQPPRPPHGGPGWGAPRPPQGEPGWQPPRPPQGGPGWGAPRPPHGGAGWQPPRPPKRPCSCPPGRPCRDCLMALQSQPDWMRDMIEVLVYQEMLHRRSRRRRWRQYQRNY